MAEVSPWVRVVAVVNQRNREHPRAFATVDTITGDDADARRRVVALGRAAETAGHPLPNLSASQTVGVVKLPADVIDLIRDLTDPRPCLPTTTGNCLTHAQRGCPHGAAQKLIAAWDEAD